jgi:uncharacterized low-complexity protein
MRLVRLALALAFATTGILTMSAVGDMSAAEAKAHVTKGKPGKCGVTKYYSKKDKGCVSKA